MNKTPIFTVTTVRGALDAGSRCVGFFHDLETATTCLVENDFDINEYGYYPYGVIEELEPGLYTYPRPEHWYKFNQDTGKYEECPKPERFKQICGWGIG